MTDKTTSRPVPLSTVEEFSAQMHALAKPRPWGGLFDAFDNAKRTLPVAWQHTRALFTSALRTPGK
jgi:hypothetical protein